MGNSSRHFGAHRTSASTARCGTPPSGCRVPHQGSAHAGDGNSPGSRPRQRWARSLAHWRNHAAPCCAAGDRRGIRACSPATDVDQRDRATTRT
jgi:hypothetical protein